MVQAAQEGLSGGVPAAGAVRNCGALYHVCSCSALDEYPFLLTHSGKLSQAITPSTVGPQRKAGQCQGKA